MNSACKLVPAAVLLAACTASLTCAAAQGRAGTRSTRPRGSRAHIVAKPSELMVNQSTMLTGSGFPKASEVALEECSSADWIAPQDPCIASTALEVKTNRAGRFSTPFKAAVCEGTSTVPPTERTCYLGEPAPSGIDTIELRGAAKVLVSWP
jgi:hypothetical protein